MNRINLTVPNNNNYYKTSGFSTWVKMTPEKSESMTTVDDDISVTSSCLKNDAVVNGKGAAAVAENHDGDLIRTPSAHSRASTSTKTKRRHRDTMNSGSTTTDVINVNVTTRPDLTNDDVVNGYIINGDAINYDVVNGDVMITSSVTPPTPPVFEAEDASSETGADWDSPPMQASDSNPSYSDIEDAVSNAVVCLRRPRTYERESTGGAGGVGAACRMTPVSALLTDGVDLVEAHVQAVALDQQFYNQWARLPRSLDPDRDVTSGTRRPNSLRMLPATGSLKSYTLMNAIVRDKHSPIENYAGLLQNFKVGGPAGVDYDATIASSVTAGENGGGGNEGQGQAKGRPILLAVQDGGRCGGGSAAAMTRTKSAGRSHSRHHHHHHHHHRPHHHHHHRSNHQSTYHYNPHQCPCSETLPPITDLLGTRPETVPLSSSASPRARGSLPYTGELCPQSAAACGACFVSDSSPTEMGACPRCHGGGCLGDKADERRATSALGSAGPVVVGREDSFSDSEAYLFAGGEGVEDDEEGDEEGENTEEDDEMAENKLYGSRWQGGGCAVVGLPERGYHSNHHNSHSHHHRHHHHHHHHQSQQQSLPMNRASLLFSADFDMREQRYRGHRLGYTKKKVPPFYARAGRHDPQLAHPAAATREGSGLRVRGRGERTRAATEGGGGNSSEAGGEAGGEMTCVEFIDLSEVKKILLRDRYEEMRSKAASRLGAWSHTAAAAASAAGGGGRIRTSALSSAHRHHGGGRGCDKAGDGSVYALGFPLNISAIKSATTL